MNTVMKKKLDALAAAWEPHCLSPASRLSLAILRRDRRALDAALARHTAAELSALQSPLPLYHAAALANWPEAVTALAAAGVLPEAADLLVEPQQQVGGIELVSLLVQATADGAGQVQPRDCLRTACGQLSAVGMAAAMGHVQAAAALLATGASATAGRSWGCLPASMAVALRWDAQQVEPMLSLLASAGGQMSPAEVADFVYSTPSFSIGSVPLLLRQLVAQRADLSGLNSQALHALGNAALHWDCSGMFELLPAETAADFLAPAAARSRADILLSLLRSGLHFSGEVQHRALASALGAKQPAVVAALLRAGVQPTASHITQAICSCQPDALSAMLAVVRPAEPPAPDRLDLRSIALLPRLPSFVHKASFLYLAADVRRMLA